MMRARSSATLFAFMAVIAMIGMNALLFAFKGSNPLVSSDAWYFVDGMLRQIPAGTFGADDLFAKRSGLDHSQPLKRLILLFHYHYFNLDFTIEAVISVMVAFVNIAMFWHIARNGVSDEVTDDKRFLLVFAALSAVYLSLNAPMIFSWSLVTMTYTTHTFIILFMAAAWHAMRDGSHRSLVLFFCAALLLNVVGDIMGVVSTIAVLVPIALASRRDKTWRRGITVAAIAVAGCVIYKAAYLLIGPSPTGVTKTARIGLDERIPLLFSQIDQAWQWLLIPLSGSVAHVNQLQALSEPARMMAGILIALVLTIFHGWFWLQAWKGRQNLASFVAIGLMLLFYGLVAAVLVTRVSLKGADYLMQVRYTLIYQWNIVALLLMALAQYAHREPQGPAASIGHAGSKRRMSAIVPAIAASLLLLLQIPLSMQAWNDVRYTSVYEQRMAIQMGQLADDPGTVPEACAAMLTICSWEPEYRARIMRFLKQNKLNVFSPAFQARNRLYPDLESVPTP